MHLLAFPLQNQSIVMAFYHKRDKKYKMLRNRFKRMTNQDILKYLNYVAFAFTSNIFFSKKIEEELNNDNLRQLSREFNGLPDFGNTVHSWDELSFTSESYSSPNIESIPCFLEEKYSIE